MQMRRLRSPLGLSREVRVGAQQMQNDEDDVIDVAEPRGTIAPRVCLSSHETYRDIALPAPQALRCSHCATSIGGRVEPVHSNAWSVRT